MRSFLHRCLVVVALLGTATSARALSIIYPAEAIRDLMLLPGDEFRAKYKGINPTAGLGLGDEGWFVRYRHENLVLYFGPLKDDSEAKKHMWEMESVRDAAIRNRDSLQNSTVDYGRYTYSDMWGDKDAEADITPGTAGDIDGDGIPDGKGLGGDGTDGTGGDGTDANGTPGSKTGTGTRQGVGTAQGANSGRLGRTGTGTSRTQTGQSARGGNVGNRQGNQAGANSNGQAGSNSGGSRGGQQVAGVPPSNPIGRVPTSLPSIPGMNLPSGGSSGGGGNQGSTFPGQPSLPQMPQGGQQVADIGSPGGSQGSRGGSSGGSGGGVGGGQGSSQGSSSGSGSQSGGSGSPSQGGSPSSGSSMPSGGGSSGGGTNPIDAVVGLLRAILGI